MILSFTVILDLVYQYRQKTLEIDEKEIIQ